MAKFRKKPVVIEAWRYLGFDRVNPEMPPQWMKSAVMSAFGDGEKVPGSTLNVGGVVHNIRDEYLDIGTLEGVMRANKGDWIIRGIKGELYPCKDDIFVATYEPVSE